MRILGAHSAFNTRVPTSQSQLSKPSNKYDSEHFLKGADYEEDVEFGCDCNKPP